MAMMAKLELTGAMNADGEEGVFGSPIGQLTMGAFVDAIVTGALSVARQVAGDKPSFMAKANTLINKAAELIDIPRVPEFVEKMIESRLKQLVLEQISVGYDRLMATAD